MRHAQGKTCVTFSRFPIVSEVHAKTNIRCSLHYIFDKHKIRRKLICFTSRFAGVDYNYSKHNEQECDSRKESGFNATREAFMKHTSHRASKGFAGEEYCQTWQAVWTTEFKTMQQLHDKHWQHLTTSDTPIPSWHLSIFTSTLLSCIFELLQSWQSKFQDTRAKKGLNKATWIQYNSRI